MKFEENFFKIFSQPKTFTIDAEELKNNFRKLQLKYHPDKFIGLSPQEHRLAVQFSSYLNNAYSVLINPIKRAEYLLEVNSIPFDKEKVTINDTNFLIEQMELRDSFERAKKNEDFKLIEELKKRVSLELDSYINNFSKLIEKSDFDSDNLKKNLQDCLCKMIFYNNLKEDLK